MDVHDTGDISRSRPLKEGMVITIGTSLALATCRIMNWLLSLIFSPFHFIRWTLTEPGLYIPRDPAYPERYQGIGIRIEDNVMIGKNAPYVLSVTAPKEIADIEYCCASGKEQEH